MGFGERSGGEHSTNISQLQLSSLQISVPTALTSALEKRSNKQTTPDAGPHAPRGSPGVLTIKPPDDSPNWLAGQGNRKNFDFYFGDNDKGRKNRAILENIKCVHHKPRGRSKYLVGICADYVAGGRCPNGKLCKLSHFLVRYSKRFAGGDHNKANKLCKQVEAAFASINS